MDNKQFIIDLPKKFYSSFISVNIEYPCEDIRQKK